LQFEIIQGKETRIIAISGETGNGIILLLMRHTVSSGMREFYLLNFNNLIVYLGNIITLDVPKLY